MSGCCVLTECIWYSRRCCCCYGVALTPMLRRVLRLYCSLQSELVTRTWCVCCWRKVPSQESLCRDQYVQPSACLLSDSVNVIRATTICLINSLIDLLILTLPYLTSRVGRLLHLPSTGAVSCASLKVTGNGYTAVNGYEAVNKRLWSRSRLWSRNQHKSTGNV